jgi:hypothetical protein
MLKRGEFLLLVTVGAFIACLVGANVGLSMSNRSSQADVQARSQYLQQSAQLEVLYREIVKALADLSVKNQDAELRALLGSHGITVTVNPPAPPAGGPTTAEPVRKGGGR